MNTTIDFARPWVFALLPLALLPLLPRRSDTLPFSWSAWLPADRTGRLVGWLARVAASLAIAAIVAGLAGPGRSHVEVRRTGRGAEILVLMDRSGSMNGVMASRGIGATGDSKNQVARGALDAFIDSRPHDRVAFMMFGISPVLAVPFTYDHGIIRDAIAGTAVGRGMPDTQLGRGLIAAIAHFDGEPHTGHRAIVLVSDGGAVLDDAERRLIATGLARNDIALYFIYLRSSIFGPKLAEATRAGGTSPEAVLHKYFMTLKTPYRLFEAGDAHSMGAAMTEINRQQNFPFSFTERLPRQDLSRACFAVALACCAVLLASRAVQVRSWS